VVSVSLDAVPRAAMGWGKGRKRVRSCVPSSFLAVSGEAQFRVELLDSAARKQPSCRRASS